MAVAVGEKKLIQKTQNIFYIAFLIFFGLQALGQSSSEAGDPSVESTMIEFEKQMIQIGSKKIQVEIARSQRQHERGLMFRTTMPENEGMIFIFERPQILNFWMKNTYIDLDIGYFDEKKRLVDVFAMKASSVMTKNLETYPSSGPAMYALEMNQGWFAKNKIKKGDRFEWIKGQRKQNHKNKK